MTFVLKETPAQLLTVFAIIAIGYLLGRVQIKGIGLGTAAIFLSGLAFGHFGFETPGALQTVGLILFITSVGFSAGPGFLQRIRRSGAAYAVLCLTVAITGSIICVLIVYVAKVETPLAVGMMTGAFTTSPGFAAAKEAASASESAVNALAAGYGLIYPIGVLCKVLFIQIVPRLLHADMAEECRKIALPKEQKSAEEKKLIHIDPMGLCVFAVAVVLGILVGGITFPLPGSAAFAFGTTGGPLLVALCMGALGCIGNVSIRPNEKLYGPAKEIGLMLFFSGSGVEGGKCLAQIVNEYGLFLLLYGFLLVAVPLAVGFFMFYKVLKLPLLNGLGSMTASMTCTPSLAVLIQMAGTDDAAAAYATTYPIALGLMVLVVQVLLNL